MADPRDAARQWLAETIHAARCGCGDLPSHGKDTYASRTADAILSAPGVEVEWRHVGRSTDMRVVIRLPAEEGTGT
jgi:hypothetical protein